MTWSEKDLNTLIQQPLIHTLKPYDTQYNNTKGNRIHIEHNYSFDASSV